MKLHSSQGSNIVFETSAVSPCRERSCLFIHHQQHNNNRHTSLLHMGYKKKVCKRTLVKYNIDQTSSPTTTSPSTRTTHTRVTHTFPPFLAIQNQLYRQWKWPLTLSLSLSKFLALATVCHNRTVVVCFFFFVLLLVVIVVLSRSDQVWFGAQEFKDGGEGSPRVVGGCL